MFNATTIGINFANSCIAGTTGTVHSVFHHALNIVISNNNILTILYQDIDIMEATCTISPYKKPLHQVAAAGQGVMLTQDIVYIANIPIVTGITSATLWQVSKPSQTTKAKAELINTCNQITIILDKHDNGNIPWPTSLKTFNPSNYIGLGDGVTPAGDDFIAGVLFSLFFLQELYKDKPHILQLTQQYLSNITTQTTQNLSKTNQISRHFLKYALNNKPGQNTQAFFNAIATNDTDLLNIAIEKKITYGASSGVDELRGCVFVIKDILQSTSPAPA